MIACLQKTDNNQAMCSNEIKSFQSCYEKFKLEDAKLQEIKQKGIRPVGPRAKYVWLLSQQEQVLSTFSNQHQTLVMVFLIILFDTMQDSIWYILERGQNMLQYFSST